MPLQTLEGTKRHICNSFLLKEVDEETEGTGQPRFMGRDEDKSKCSMVGWDNNVPFQHKK